MLTIEMLTLWCWACAMFTKCTYYGAFHLNLKDRISKNPADNFNWNISLKSDVWPGESEVRHQPQPQHPRWLLAALTAVKAVYRHVCLICLWWNPSCIQYCPTSVSGRVASMLVCAGNCVTHCYQLLDRLELLFGLVLEQGQPRCEVTLQLTW